MTDQSSVTGKDNRVSKSRRFLLGGFALVVLGVVFAPGILARSSFRDRLINAIIAAPTLSATTEEASLGWLSPVSVTGLRIDGKEHRFRVEVESVEANGSWPRLLFSSSDLGRIRVEKPTIWMKFPLGPKGSVSPIFVPRFTAEVNDAALSIQLERTEDPLIEINGVDMTVSLLDSEKGLLLSVDPFEVYRRERMTPEHCDQLLSLINPSLHDVADMEGEFSLAMSKLNVPVGLAEEDLLRGLEVEGELSFHEVSVESENDMLRTLAKLVADAHQKHVPERTKVVKDAQIEFEVRDGRLHHQGLRFGFPDIDPELEVQIHGSVGFDQSLDAYLEVPRLDRTKRKQRGPIVCHVTGTVSKPRLSAKDASLVVRIPNRDEPLIDVDGVDLTARIEESAGGRVIAFDPMSVLDRERLDRQLAGALLHLIEPDLQYSPQLDGEVSLSIDTLRIPIEVPDDEWLNSFEVSGKLVIHEATSYAETPIRQAVIKLLADLYGKQPTHSVRVAHNAEIEFRMKDGRFYFDGLRAGFPDIDSRLEMTSRGSIGLDDTLDIYFEIPRLDSDKSKERGPVLCHLTGTVDSPQLTAEDASLVVHLPDRPEPLIDVDGVDLTMRVVEHEGRRLISVDPVELLRSKKISRQLATGLLHLVDPELQYSPELVGEVSLSVDTLRIPVGLPDEQWMEALEAHGTLEIHQAASLVQSPLRMAVAKLLADLYSIEPGEAVRVVHQAKVTFGLQQGRFHFQGLRFGFPDIDRELQIQVEGSVGLDQTLDLRLQLPRLDAAKRREKGSIACQITGTVSNPRMVVTDASLVVRLPEHEQPLLDVDAIDLVMEIEYDEETPVLNLMPMQVFNHRRVTTQRGEEWLRLITPTLADVADVQGEFSLSIDSLRVPLSGRGEQLLRSVQFSGILQLHDITTAAETPLLAAMAKVLADQYGKTPSETIRVAKDAEIQFELRDGKLFQEGLEIGFPDLSPDLVCRSSGSVGLDGSLDLILQVPAILAKQQNGKADELHFKVTGTIDAPKVEEMEK